jgi:hypothetical protein
MRQTAARFENPRVVALPVRRFLLRSADYVQPRVMRRIAATRRNRHGYVRTGRSRKSVQRKMDTAMPPRWVSIFTNLLHMRSYEFGYKPRNQKPRRPFFGTLRRSRRKIFEFARQARDEMARMLRGR